MSNLAVEDDHHLAIFMINGNCILFFLSKKVSGSVNWLLFNWLALHYECKVTVIYSQLSLRQTPSGPASAVRLRDVRHNMTPGILK